MIKQPFFVGASNTALEGVLKDDMILFTQGQITDQEVMADLDASRDAVLEEAHTSERIVVGVAEETFTVLQAAQLFADIFRERADAQIGLCLANTKYQGCNYKLYQGDLVYGNAAGNTLEYFIDDGFKNGLSAEEGGNGSCGLV